MRHPARSRWMGSLLLLLSLLSTASAQAEDAGGLEQQDAHYLVFNIEGEEVRLVSAQRVRLAAPLDTFPARDAAELAAEESALRSGDAVEVRLESAGGEILYREVVAVPRWTRAELHGRQIRPGVHEIESHPAEAKVRVFVARIPVLPSVRNLVVAGARRTTFDVRQLVALETSAPAPAAIVRPFSVGRTGNPANRLDLLILGDGYTVGQESQFNADVQRIAEQFFELSPYAEYRSFVNVHGLFISSAEEGADHPPYSAGCSPGSGTCCADPAAQADPRAGTFVSTAFDASFCGAGTTQRVLTADAAKAMTAAAAVPNWDRILLIVNDTQYGGSGGEIPVGSLHVQGIDILQHEFGHSFTLLADEYDSAYPGYPGCSDRSGTPCEANVTDETAPHLIKWSPWIAASTPIPTPESSSSSGRIGLFQGARYHATGMYRPRDTQCLMHFLGVPFDEVCRQEYVRQLYRGRWGRPASGIELIEPGSESPKPGNVAGKAGVATRLAADLLKPQGKVGVTWLVDGVAVPGATDSIFRFTPPAAGTYRVELRVKDETSFIHPEMAGDLLGSSREWTVKATGPAAACVPSGKRLCIDRQPGDRRFQVDVDYQTAQASGQGNAVPLTSLGVDRGGLFWFFEPDNPEMLVKVLDGCALNQRFWVFYAAVTNVGLTITVTDTVTGESKVYRNPRGTAAAPVQDTSALRCE